jgi:dCMP deaminase
MDNLKIIKELKRVQNLSVSNKRKVGAVLVYNNKIISSGFNKNIFGTTCENIDNETYQHIIHAEEDCIFNYLKQNLFFTLLSEATLWITYTPCNNCCKLIVQSGIKNVIYLEKHPKNFDQFEIYNDISCLEFLEKNGVNITQFSKEKKEIPKNNVKINHDINDLFFTNSDKILIVYHNRDADGLFSLLLMYLFIKINENKKSFLIDVDYLGWDYDKNFWDNKDLLKYTQIFFVDLCPNEEFLSIFTKTDNFYKTKLWIFDHHKSNNDNFIELFNSVNSTKLLNIDCYLFSDNHQKELKLYSSNNMYYPIKQIHPSAALIVFMELKKHSMFSPLFFDEFEYFITDKQNNELYTINDIVTLIFYVSLYDSWEFIKSEYKDIKDSVLAINCIFREATNLYELKKLFNNESFVNLLITGKYQNKLNKINAINIVESAEKNINNTELLKDYLNKNNLNLKIFEIHEVSLTYYIQEYIWEKYNPDIIIGVKKLENGKTSISMRSLNQDVCKIAEFYGGGGHKLSAGFVIENIGVHK